MRSVLYERFTQLTHYARAVSSSLTTPSDSDVRSRSCEFVDRTAVPREETATVIQWPFLDSSQINLSPPVSAPAALPRDADQ
jgi:hypothetical protein